MDIIKNLICLENNKASVIRLKEDKLEFVKKDGEVDFPITVDFWEWWKNVVSYINGDSVDICFVYDKQYDLLLENDITKNNIINSNNSNWEIEYIKQYFWKLKPTYFNLVIVGPEQQEYALSGDNNVVAKRFYTNLNFKVPNNVPKPLETILVEDSTPKSLDEDYSEFAKFFIDLIRRERG